MTISAVRLQLVRRDLEAEGLDALVVSEPGNRRWLTGFTGSAGWSVVTKDDAFLMTDSRYFEQVEREAPSFRLERYAQRPLDRLAELLLEGSVRRVGIDRDNLTIGQHETLRDKGVGIEWVPTSGTVEAHRAVKEPWEVEVIGRAAALTDRAMEHAVRIARPGITERQAAWELERFMRENGAEGMAFAIIVAAGENGALPHHTPSDRTIGAGEPIVIDMGARIDGYNGDLTRTFALGDVDDPEYARVYAVVDEANQAAVAGIRPGMTGREADELARRVIRDAGFAEFFGHGLGHGVGLNVHEGPRLGPSADDVTLREGMIVTVEPGIYLPGRFGVRIEDLVVVRAAGVEMLSAAPKRPVIEAS